MRNQGLLHQIAAELDTQLSALTGVADFRDIRSTVAAISERHRLRLNTSGNITGFTVEIIAESAGGKLTRVGALSSRDPRHT
jgi:hypothetical protein